jgi:HSP20 family molecular chaperone IbpA
MDTNNQIPGILSSLIESNINSSFAEQLSDILRSSQTGIENMWKPNIDLIETENFVHLLLTVAGVNPDSIDVDFFNNYVIIKGERSFPNELNNNIEISTRRQEIIYGNFERKIMLPISVTRNESVSINLENGILVIKIDKTIERSNRFSVRLNNNNTET